MSTTSARSIEAVRENFSRISKQLEELQISHDEWRKYITAKQELDVFLDGSRATNVFLYIKVAISFVVAVCFFLLLFFAVFDLGMIPEDSVLGSAHYGIAKFVVETIDKSKLKEDNCILQFVDPLQDLFRPPVDCSMCANISSIDVRVNLTSDEFRSKYAYSSRPLVVTDGMEGWTAINTFSYEYLKEVYAPGSRALESAEDDCQFFPYRTSFEKLGEVFNMTVDQAYLRDGEESKPWYIGWSNCDSAAANTLRRHYKKPYFLPEDSESSKVDWIFMGSPGYGAPNHIDAVDLPSWQAQVKGHKIWTLNPPPECYLECGGEMSVTLHPGYIVIVDTNSWFHSTKVVGDEMSITIGSEYD